MFLKNRLGMGSPIAQALRALDYRLGEGVAWRLSRLALWCLLTACYPFFCFFADGLVSDLDILLYCGFSQASRPLPLVAVTPLCSSTRDMPVSASHYIRLCRGGETLCHTLPVYARGKGGVDKFALLVAMAFHDDVDISAVHA